MNMYMYTNRNITNLQTHTKLCNTDMQTQTHTKALEEFLEYVWAHYIQVGARTISYTIMHTHTYKWISHPYTQTRTHVHAHTFTHTHSLFHTHMSTHTHTNIHATMLKNTHTYIHAPTCTLVHRHIHAHIKTNTPTHKPVRGRTKGHHTQVLDQKTHLAYTWILHTESLRTNIYVCIYTYTYIYININRYLYI